MGNKKDSLLPDVIFQWCLEILHTAKEKNVQINFLNIVMLESSLGDHQIQILDEVILTPPPR